MVNDHRYVRYSRHEARLHHEEAERLFFNGEAMSKRWDVLSTFNHHTKYERPLKVTRKNSRPPSKKNTKVATGRTKKSPQRKQQMNAVVVKPFKLLDARSQNKSRLVAFGKCEIQGYESKSIYPVRIEFE